MESRNHKQPVTKNNHQLVAKLIQQTNYEISFPPIVFNLSDISNVLFDPKKKKEMIFFHQKKCPRLLIYFTCSSFK